MKKIIFFLMLLPAAFVVSAQEDIAVFVYSTSKLNESTTALRSRIVGAIQNNSDNKYRVVDRSEEFWTIQKMEFGYQERGFVSNKELVEAGKQLGADKVCGVVITYYGEKEGYFLECKILDIKDNRLEAQAEYPRVGDEDPFIKELGIATSQMVATSLAEQLNMASEKMKKEADKIRAKQATDNENKAAERERDSIANERKVRNDKFHCAMASQGGSLASSVVIPGLGLINKGHTGLGITFLAAEAGLVTGTVLIYNDAQKLLTTLRDPNITAENFTVANAQYNSKKVWNHVFLGAAATVYVTNLIVTLACDDKKAREHNCSIDATYIKTDSDFAPALSLTFKF